jgi:hypothetical protein
MSDKRVNNGGHSTAGKAGRKSKDEELKIRNLTSPYALDAIQTVVEIMTSDKSRPADRLSAAKLLIEYTYGKPKETIDQNLTVSNFDIKDLFKFDNNKGKI